VSLVEVLDLGLDFFKRLFVDLFGFFVNGFEKIIAQIEHFD
jgi:hypothetical protein